MTQPITNEIYIQFADATFPSINAATIKNDYVEIAENQFLLCVPDVMQMYVEDGNKILLLVEDNVDYKLVSAYILGTGMGVIMHQRGMLLLHGSCVTKEDQAIVFIGPSGAGKSTMASEFMQHGWRLVSDDVVPVCFIDGKPFAQSSYPLQKICMDVLDQYTAADADVYLQHREDGRVKYYRDCSKDFQTGLSPISSIVLLSLTNKDMIIYALIQNNVSELIACAETIKRNVYRDWVSVTVAQKQSLFQKSIDLSGSVNLIVAQRNESNLASELYQGILDQL